MLLPSQNKHLAQKYFESLPEWDVNRKIYDQNQDYEIPKGLFKRMWNAYKTHDTKLQYLESFYPYQKTIKATVLERNRFFKFFKKISDFEYWMKASAVATAVSWYLLFQMGRRGYVLPLLREYGRIFKTHRLFRHYVWSLVLPIGLSTDFVYWKYSDHIEALWKIHCNRLKAKDLTDPDHTYYPASLSKLAIFYYFS